jgi:hypothetical protein
MKPVRRLQEPEETRELSIVGYPGHDSATPTDMDRLRRRMLARRITNPLIVAVSSQQDDGHLLERTDTKEDADDSERRTE